MDQPYAQNALAVLARPIGQRHLPRAGSRVRTVDSESGTSRAQSSSNFRPRYKALFVECLDECLDVVAVYKTDDALANHVAKWRIPAQVARAVRDERLSPGVGACRRRVRLYTKDMGHKV
jgi:hypothetical protein